MSVTKTLNFDNLKRFYTDIKNYISNITSIENKSVTFGMQPSEKFSLDGIKFIRVTKIIKTNPSNVIQIYFENDTTPPSIQIHALTDNFVLDVENCKNVYFEAFYDDSNTVEFELIKDNISDFLMTPTDKDNLNSVIQKTNVVSNSSTIGGIVKLGDKIYGLQVVENGILGLVPASDNEIEAQTSNWRAITPKNTPKAVKEGITNNSIELTSAEKKSVRDWIGVEAQIGEWEKVVDKTLSSDSPIALNFTDFNFGGNYKKIMIQIRGTMDVNNANIFFYRANISTAYGIFANVGKTAETTYEFIVEEKPFLRMDSIRESTATFKSILASNNLVQNQGAIPIASAMSGINELKISADSGSNFLTGTRVVVWGLK